MPASIITADVFSALFLIIILCSEVGNVNKQSSYFKSISILTFIGLLLHALSVILANYILFSENVILGLIIMLVSMAIMVVFAYYLISVISEKKSISIWGARAVLIAEIICAVFVIAMIIYEYSSYGEVQSFTFGAIFFTMFGIQAACSIHLLTIILVRFRLFTKRSAISLIIYLALPFISLIIRFFFGDFDYMMSAIALSLTIVYLGLQNLQMIEFKIREQICADQPVTDELTGLGSKRAFLNLKNIILAKEAIGIVCCSLNELKHINDTQGDTAGDELIQQLAYLIKNDFSRYDTFRVSGDKFIVVITNEDIDVFKNVVIDFMKDINAYDNIASVGSSFGLGKDFDELMREAEKLMYENKRSYYEQKSHDRRAVRR